MPDRPGTQRRPRLTRARIVDAALGLVDDKGVAGLTMRALAARLGVDPMAVYRHVRDKEDLLGALCDALLADLGPIDPGAPWEPQIRRLAGDLRARLVARPALLPALAAGPVTPAGVAAAGDAIELLVRAGLTAEGAATAFGAVFAYVLGFAVVEAAVPPVADHGALRRDALAHMGRPDEPPPAHLDEAILLMSSAGDFDDGLELVLDGLRRRIGA